ncbi:MAG: S1C family serine protease, partial [Planctomycetota bacterium]
MRRFVTSIPAILVLFTVATVLVAAPAAIKSIHGAQLAARIALAQNTLAHSDALDQISLERSAVHDAVMPSVVHIITIDGRRARQNPETYNLGIGASGAGWFWDDQGHIITNAHVVEVGDLVRVETFDGRVRRADVLYRDEQTDIAVLK